VLPKCRLEFYSEEEEEEEESVTEFLVLNMSTVLSLACCIYTYIFSQQGHWNPNNFACFFVYV